MIAAVFRLVPDEYAHLNPRLIAVTVAQALSQAAAYCLLVPLLEALFDGDTGRAWRWAAVMAVAVALMGGLTVLQATLGLRIA
ncbi:MAG: ABC transporter ATP-binding protein, partial [Rhodococcus fascians]